jgi:molybdopterin converting factor small subunit
MAVRILIPTPLRPFTGGRDTLQLEGATVDELLKALISEPPDLQRHLYSDEGKLRSFVNVYVNDEDIRYLERERTAVSATDTISIAIGRRRQYCGRTPATGADP